MKWIKGFGFAFNGLKVSWREQLNFRIHVGSMILVVALGVYFRIKAWEWVALLLSGGLVIGLELINTSIESAVDLITREQNPLAGKVKDIAAAGVLVAVMASVVVGGLIFWKYFYAILAIAVDIPADQ